LVQEWSKSKRSECKSFIRVGREPRGGRGPYRKGTSRHFIFFNFVATLKKYLRKEVEREIFYYSLRVVCYRGPSVATPTPILVASVVQEGPKGGLGTTRP